MGNPGAADHPWQAGRAAAAGALADFCRSVEAEPLWGINVSTATPAETAQFLARLRELGAPANGFELGNEMYLNAYRPELPTVEDYLAACRAHAAEVKKVFPQAKVAVCASERGTKRWSLGVDCREERVTLAAPVPVPKWSLCVIPLRGALRPPGTRPPF